MPVVTMADVRRISEQHGHSRPSVSQSRRGWFGTCGCGFRSARQPDQAHAEQLVAEHIIRAVEVIIKRERASGNIAV